MRAVIVAAFGLVLAGVVSAFAADNAATVFGAKTVPAGSAPHARLQEARGAP